MNYYKRLKDLREDNDLTQKQIAEIIGTSQSYYAQYENGHRQIPLDRFIILADFYGVTLDYLAGRTDKPEAGAASALPPSAVRRN